MRLAKLPPSARFITRIGRKSGDDRAAPIVATRAAAFAGARLVNDDHARWNRRRRGQRRPRRRSAPLRPERLPPARSSAIEMSPATTSAALLATKFCRQNAVTGAVIAFTDASVLISLNPYDADRHTAPSPSPVRRPATGCRMLHERPGQAAPAAGRFLPRKRRMQRDVGDRSSSAPKFLLSERPAIVVASIVPRRSPRAKLCHLIRKLQRISRRPAFVEHALTKLARPGSSRDCMSLPVRNTTLAATTGNPRRSFSNRVKPLASVADCGL